MKKEESSDLIGQRNIRIGKVDSLKKLGIDPYPAKSQRDTRLGDINSNFSDLEGKEVTVAGRLMSWRTHGQLVFGDIQEQTGKIQLYIKADELKETSKELQTVGFEDLNLIDIGDIVEAKGFVTKTQRGEISVQVSEFKILTKSIRPLPSKNEGLKDKELIFRKRYLDVITSPERNWRFQKVSEITFALRKFLHERGFLEIRTPILQPLYGGTNAKPFKTRVNALDIDFYLAVAHELYLKRLTVAGYENVYNMVGYFRNEGIDRTHNPEFNMLETMTAYKNYEFNMELMEDMYKYIGQEVFGRTEFKVLGQDVDFGQPWERIKMIDAVKKHAGYDFNDVKTLEQAHKILDEIGFKEEKANSIGESMVQVFEEKVEEKLIKPTFVYGHPVEISPLAKTMKDDPRFVERFEIFMAGIENGDNWTELNDPIELYERFKVQTERGRGGNEEFHPMDVEFLEAMEYGMPPTTGIGPGIERFCMMFLETEYIDDVLFFPLMRPAKYTDIQKEIYGEEYLMGQEDNINMDEDEDVHGLPSREEALSLLSDYVDDKYHLLHAKMVGNAMEAYAKKLDKDTDLWYLTGLLHDLDYTKFPDEHPYKALELFKKNGYSKDLIHAVEAHDFENTGVKPKTLLAAMLVANDEMSGLLYAYAIMRPEKFKDMKQSSVMKKFKDKNFAPKISRNDISYGVRLAKLDMNNHIAMLTEVFNKMDEFN